MDKKLPEEGKWYLLEQDRNDSLLRPAPKKYKVKCLSNSDGVLYFSDTPNIKHSGFYILDSYIGDHWKIVKELDENNI